MKENNNSLKLDWYDISKLTKLIEEKILQGVDIYSARKFTQLFDKLESIRKNTEKPEDWD